MKNFLQGQDPQQAAEEWLLITLFHYRMSNTTHRAIKQRTGKNYYACAKQLVLGNPVDPADVKEGVRLYQNSFEESRYSREFGNPMEYLFTMGKNYQTLVALAQTVDWTTVPLNVITRLQAVLTTYPKNSKQVAAWEVEFFRLTYQLTHGSFKNYVANMYAEYYGGAELSYSEEHRALQRRLLQRKRWLLVNLVGPTPCNSTGFVYQVYKKRTIDYKMMLFILRTRPETLEHIQHQIKVFDDMFNDSTLLKQPKEDGMGFQEDTE